MRYLLILLLAIQLSAADTVPAWFVVLHGKAMGYSAEEINTIYTKGVDVPLQRVALPDTTILGNITVTLKPLALKSTKLVYNNTQVLLWTIAIKNNSIYNLGGIDRNTLMIELPNIVDFPNNLAQDILTRDSSNSFWSISKALLQQILSIGPSGLTAAGLATNNKTLGYWGLGVAVITYLVSRASTRAPNPAPYFSNLLPDIISVAAGRSSPTYYLVTPVVLNAQSIKLSLNIPIL